VVGEGRCDVGTMDSCYFSFELVHLEIIYTEEIKGPFSSEPSVHREIILYIPGFGSGWDPDLYLESGSGPLRAEVIFCNLDVLYGGLHRYR
jgi:hypothetical protein